MHLRETLTPSEYRDWTLHYKRTGLVPDALRFALARNTHITLAAMVGSEKAGPMRDYLDPPLLKEERARASQAEQDAALDAIEKDLGV